MRKKETFLILAGLVLFSLLFLPSCKKMELVEVVGFIQGHVYDANDNTPLDNVTIKWGKIGGGQDSVVATAVDGFFIENLKPGEYILECSKEGYAVSTFTVEIPEEEHSASIKGGGGLEFIATENPALYSLGANVTGRIYKYSDPVVSNTATPAAGAIVRLIYPFGNMVPNTYQATTDDNGYYTFENVPAAGGNVMIADYYDENFYYYPYIDDYDFSFSASSGATSSIEPVFLTPYESIISHPFYNPDEYWSDPLVLVGSNVQIAPGVGANNFSVSDNIELEFNRPLNEEITNGIYNHWGNPAWFTDQFFVDVTYTVTFSGNKLIIDPDADLSADTYYQLGVAVCGESMSDLYYTGWYNPGYIGFKTAP